jgi:hypothetical protein
MESPSDTPRPDSFTQCCRDLVRALTYEDILGCTMYAAPMVFMVGPASIVGNDPFIAVVVQSLMGFVLGWTMHRMGHGLLTALPKEPRRLYLSQSRCLPVRLTLTQFLWMMELLVGAAVFAAVLGKRLLHSIDSVGLLSGLGFLIMAIGLYFVPSYLGRLWIRHHDPAMTLVGPTEAVIKTSLPGIRFLFTFTHKS